jgi:uncharacterized protein (TIGR03067 family)
MKRILLPVALLGLVLTAAEPPTEKAPEKVTDNDRLQGTWRITTVDFNGQLLPEGPELRQFKGVRLTFENDKVINSRSFKKSPYILNATKSPGTLDIIEAHKDGDHKMLYLYTLDGDTLKLCFTSTSGTTRPGEMTSQNKQILLTLQRYKK